MNDNQICIEFDAETLERLTAAARETDLTPLDYILLAVYGRLDMLQEDSRLTWERKKAYEARDTAEAAEKKALNKRDSYKTMLEAAERVLAHTQAQLEAIEGQSWWDRLFGRTPQPKEPCPPLMTLEMLDVFENRLKEVGMTVQQVHQILRPLEQLPQHEG